MDDVQITAANMFCCILGNLLNARSIEDSIAYLAKLVELLQ